MLELVVNRILHMDERFKVAGLPIENAARKLSAPTPKIAFLGFLRISSMIAHPSPTGKIVPVKLGTNRHRVTPNPTSVITIMRIVSDRDISFFSFADSRILPTRSGMARIKMVRVAIDDPVGVHNGLAKKVTP